MVDKRRLGRQVNVNLIGDRRPRKKLASQVFCWIALFGRKTAVDEGAIACADHSAVRQQNGIGYLTEEERRGADELF